MKFLLLIKGFLMHQLQYIFLELRQTSPNNFRQIVNFHIQYRGLFENYFSQYPQELRRVLAI